MTEAANHFRATKRKREDPGPVLIQDLPVKRKPKAPRRADDTYLTGDTTPIRSLLARDGERIRALGAVWDPACGAGDMVKVIRAEGIPCSASDLVDRRCPDSWQADFFSCGKSRGASIITNPPFNLINAKGRGLWLKHSLAMPGWRYMALLLSWNWPAGRINGMGALLDLQPFSYVYLMRFRIDFTGEGDPPNQHAWFVFDRDDPRGPNCEKKYPDFRFLDAEDARQKEIDLA